MLKLGDHVGTFSIVALDPVTQELGVAVHSRYFSVGSIVPWAKSGVGAIATQAFANVSYGPRGLELLAKGLAVGDVVKELVDEDEAREYRQLAVVDSKGNVEAFTGKNCFKWAGSRIGRNYVALGNILASEGVVDAMGRQFESSDGDLAQRMVGALEVGEKRGGDLRGKQSAALLVVRERHGRGKWGDRYVDLRVEDHSDPIRELRRLLGLSHVYRLIDESENRLASGDLEEALSTIREAVSLNPQVADAHLDLGILSLRVGERNAAKKAFRRALEINPNIRELIKQLPDVHLIRRDEDLFSELHI
jgi:uncharacterized Ntn-hydrolase superfamily protein